MFLTTLEGMDVGPWTRTSPLTPHLSSHPMLSRMASLLVCNLPSCHRVAAFTLAHPLPFISIWLPSFYSGSCSGVNLFRFNSTPTLSPPIGLVSLHSSGPSPTRHRLVHPYTGRATPESREHISSAHRVCSSSGST